MKTPTDVLRDEHRVILTALTTLDAAAARLAAGRALPEGWWERIIAWLRAFADKNHHAKEEASLFPALVKAGVPAEGGPIAVMLEEHTAGRALVQTMATAAAPGARGRAAQDYVRLLRDHIAKEDGVLWPLAEAVLDERAMAAVAREFENVEAEQGRDASVAWAEAVVQGLTDALG
ncbi:MAG: hemerythrin domain-containing protein [Candidatus Rokubacteria bacterium]|nr:hemerythrin domain-containing protein [Candidatus Rokubacteria bacterium]